MPSIEAIRSQARKQNTDVAKKSATESFSPEALRGPTTADRLLNTPTPAELKLGTRSTDAGAPDTSSDPADNKWQGRAPLVAGPQNHLPTPEIALGGVPGDIASRLSFAPNSIVPGLVALQAQQVDPIEENRTSLTPAEATEFAEDLAADSSPWGKVEYVADTIEHLDEASTDLVIDAIIKADPSATEFWLNADTIGQEVDNGRISEDSRAQIVESFARNYNSSDVSEEDYQNAVFFTGAHLAPGIGSGVSSEERAEDHQATLDLFDSSDATEVQLFRQIFGKDLLEHSVDGSLRGNHANYASTLGLEILGGSTNKNILPSVYGSFSEDQRAQIVDQAFANDTGHSYGTDGFNTLLNGLAEVETDKQIHEMQDANGDGFPEITGSNSAGELAVELVQFIGAAPEDSFFTRNHRPREERADAVGNLFAAHSDAILDAFAENTLQIDPTDGNSLADNNKELLGTILRLTALNPNNAHYESSKQALNDYIDGQANEIARLDGIDNRTREQNQQLEAAIDSLKVIGKALGEGVQQARDGIQRDQEQREALIEATVGTVFDLLPISRTIGLDAFKKALSEDGGLDAHLTQKLVDKLFKEGVSLTQEQLSERLTEVLSEDEELLLELTGEANISLAIIKDALYENNVDGGIVSDISHDISGDIDDD